MKKLLYSSLIFNFLLIGFFIGKRIYYSNSGPKSIQQAETWADMWNRGRVTVLNDSKIDTGDIVFIGDSITEGFLVSEIFGNKAKNQGISSNLTRHVLSRISSVADAHPKKVILTIGVNDLREDVAEDTILNNLRNIIAIIRNQSPKTMIIVNSIFPTNGQYIFTQPKISAFNIQLHGYCNLQGIPYVDVYNALLKNNQLDSAYTFDGIHLNDAGYRIWKDRIADYVK